VIYAAAFGILLFGELPDVWSLIGYVIIIGTAFTKWYLVTQRS
jgi:drug/metabolite transporter (DMT)-like permease